MAKRIFLPETAIFFLGILFVASCAPVATTVGTTPTSAPIVTNTAPALPPQNSTETPVPEVVVGVVEVDLLNVREGPGTNYPILSSLAKGEKFYVLADVMNGTNNRWLLVSPSGDSFGWVTGDQSYVTIQKEIVDLSAYLIWQNNLNTAQTLLSALTPTP